MTDSLVRELEKLQAKRKLDLDLCHVRSAGMGAEINQLTARLARPNLERIRDRILLRHPPHQRRRLEKILTEFLEQI
jgi:hypothetical protein